MKGERLHIQQRFQIGVVFCSLFLALMVGRMFYLQTFRHGSLYTQSENNRIRIQPVVPKRGMVFDRNHNILIDNRASYILSVVPVAF